MATIGRLGRAQALIELGDRDGGVALMDQAMVAVQSDALSPQAAGLVTCGAIVTCQRLLEVTRAQEWVFALSTWCEAHSDLVPYRGQCLVHRAELLRLRGAWTEATAAAEAATTWLQELPRWATRGTSAASCTGSAASTKPPRRRTARRRGPAATRSPASRSCGWSRATSRRPPASIRRLADEARGPLERARVLAPYVEVALAAGQLADARTGADELTRIAGEIGGHLSAPRRRPGKALVLAEGDPARALRTSGGPGGCGTTSARPTRPHGSGCWPPRRVPSSGTPTARRWSSTRPGPHSSTWAPVPSPPRSPVGRGREPR